MSNQAFELAILISLKDAASAGADRVTDRLRNMGREGKQSLKLFEDLRNNLKRDLFIGGIGMAGLQAMRGGIKSAGDFEAALGDLRMSLQELGSDGRVNLLKLGDEMNRAEQLSLKLGNALPGTTQDFIQMLSTLKQGGLDVQTILGGAGEAVANLAVVTGNVPAQLAEPFSQYVQQFAMKGEETTKLASTLAKLRFSTGLTPQELIEGSKFFQTRAGMPLGLTGLQGAEQSGRLLATLRSFGLEGGVGGRELGGFMVGLTFNSKEQQKQIAEMKKKTGVSLEFFDKKGGFLGFDNVFAQMEKLRTLSTKQRLQFGEKLFGKEGMGIASIMMKAGVEGWSQINQRIDKVPSLQELINQKTQTYNAKLEAVQGTFENLKATAFTPLLDRLKPALDLTNQLAGSLQGFAKEHQTTAGIAGNIVGIASATAMATAGIKGLTTAYKLWEIASDVSSGQKAVLQLIGAGPSQKGATTRAVRASLTDIMEHGLGGVNKQIDRAGQGWADKMRGVGGKVGKAFGAGLAVAVPLYITEQYLEGWAATQASRESAKAAGERLGESILDGLKQRIEGKLDAMAMFKLLKQQDEKEAKDRVGQFAVGDKGGFFSGASEFNTMLALATGEDFYRKQGYGTQLFNPVTWKSWNPELQKQGEEGVIGKLAGASFSRPGQIVQFLMEARGELGRAGQPEAFAALKRLAEEAYPQWRQQIEAGDASVQTFNGGLNTASSGLITFGGNLAGFRPPAFSFGRQEFPLPVKPLFGGPVAPGRSVVNPAQSEFHLDKIGKLATGGDIESEGLVHLHAGERVLPARVTKGLKNGALGEGGGLVNYGGIHLHVHVPTGSRAADEPEAFADYALKQITRKVLRQRERR